MKLLYWIFRVAFYLQQPYVPGSRWRYWLYRYGDVRYYARLCWLDLKIAALRTRNALMRVV